MSGMISAAPGTARECRAGRASAGRPGTRARNLSDLTAGGDRPAAPAARLARQALRIKRSRIDLAADRRVAGDDHARADFNRQSAQRDGLRRRGAIIAIQRIARGERRGAEVGFRSTSDMRTSYSPPRPARCRHPRKRAIRYPRSAGAKSRSRGVLDTPLSRVTTGSGVEAAGINWTTRKCEAAMAVGALDPGVPYESRWAPYDRIHGPGQGQFPEGSIRPRGYMAPDARHSFASPM